MDTSLPRDFFEKHDPLLINIGGYIKKSGWINVNSQKSSFGSLHEAEIVRELHDLKVGVNLLFFIQSKITVLSYLGFPK